MAFLEYDGYMCARLMIGILFLLFVLRALFVANL